MGIFNFVIGNMDAHAKNLSFNYQGKQIRLAPFYDMMCLNIDEDLSQRLSMKIGGENRPNWLTRTPGALLIWVIIRKI